MSNIHSIIIPEETLEEWQQLADILTWLLGSPIALINRYCETAIETQISSSNPENPFNRGAQFPLDGVYCGEVIKSRKKLIVKNALKDEAWKDTFEAEAGLLSYLGYPIYLPGGALFGTICVVDRKEHEYNEMQQKVVERFKYMVESHMQLLFKNEELERRLSEIKTLRSLLPICSNCKKVRDDEGYWSQIDNYILKHTGTEFSHGICPDCMKKLYPDY